MVEQMIKEDKMKDLYRYEVWEPEQEMEDNEFPWAGYEYKGFAPACASVSGKGKFCYWWGGDGLCLLAISASLLDRDKQGIEKLKDEERVIIKKDLEEHGRFCPLEIP